MKTILSLVLSLALVQVAQAENSPRSVSAKSVQPCWLEIIIPVMIIGIWCMNRYDRDTTNDQYMPPLPLPALPGPLPPGWTTNDLPPVSHVTPRVSLDPQSVYRQDVSAYHWPDTQGGGEFTNQVNFCIQSSADLTNWTRWLGVTCWQSAAGQLIQITDGTTTNTRYGSGQLYWPSVPNNSAFFRISAQ